MNLIRWIAGLFSGGGGGSSGRNLPIYVLSRRCNEPIAGQVDLYNELSLDEEESGYFCRKVLHTSGESRCFDQVEVSIWFDNKKNLTEHEVTGGRWLTESEYEQELIRFNTPPDTDDDVVPTLAESSETDAPAPADIQTTDLLHSADTHSTDIHSTETEAEQRPASGKKSES